MKTLSAFLLGFFLSLTLGCSGPKNAHIIAYDQICLPGENIELLAKLQSNDLFKSNLKKEEIHFFNSNGELIGKGKTETRGFSKVQHTINKEGFIHIRAEIVSKKYKAKPAPLLIRSAAPETKFIIVDIDNTISNISPILMLLYENANIPPVKEAPETLQQLSKEYTIIYITGRDISLAAKTKEWLKQYHFPEGPVFFWDFLHTPLSKKKYKTELIDQIGRKFELIQIGIGNSVSDAAAYISNGLTALILLTDEEKKRADQLPRGARIVNNWQEIQNLLY